LPWAADVNQVRLPQSICFFDASSALSKYFIVSWIRLTREMKRTRDRLFIARWVLVNPIILWFGL
jgi:hypothetical protein